MTSLKKIYITSLIALIPLSISCMQINMQHIKKIERRNKDIKKRSTDIINNFHQNKDIIDPSADLRVIKDRHTLMQEKINNKYKAVFMGIQQMYNIDFDFYTYLQNIEQHLTIDNEKKTNIHPELSTHQEIRPSHLLSHFKKTLRKNNVAESLVTFAFHHNNYDTTSPTFSACIEDDLLHIHVDKPGYINIRKKIIDTSLNAQKGCCIALMNQFKHATNSALLYLIINAMAEKTVNKEEFYTLISPNKSLSLLNFALKNPRSANLLKQFYLEVYSPLLSIRDYNKLCKIATLDSTLAWLTKYEQNNQKPAIQNISVPQYTICTSCLRKTKIDDSKNTDYPECCDNCRSADFNLKLIGF